PTLPAPRSAAPVGASAVAAVAHAPRDEEPSLDLDDFLELWPAVLDGLRPETPMLADLLGRARPVAVAGDVVTVAFSRGASFLKRQAEGDRHRAAATEAVRATTGRRLALVYELRDDVEPDAEGAESAPALSEDELVARLVAEFDAEEIDAPEEGGS
ncbi:MAG: polymerase subunit gamma/tau, partial [Solirubrobacteraceae bacterium]|nr:polymerase subunit gamma/tau [Solirubrobacteraceae bacterium]